MVQLVSASHCYSPASSQPSVRQLDQKGKRTFTSVGTMVMAREARSPYYGAAYPWLSSAPTKSFTSILRLIVEYGGAVSERRSGCFS